MKTHPDAAYWKCRAMALVIAFSVLMPTVYGYPILGYTSAIHQAFAAMAGRAWIYLCMYWGLWFLAGCLVSCMATQVKQIISDTRLTLPVVFLIATAISFVSYAVSGPIKFLENWGVGMGLQYLCWVVGLLSTTIGFVLGLQIEKAKPDTTFPGIAGFALMFLCVLFYVISPDTQTDHEVAVAAEIHSMRWEYETGRTVREESVKAALDSLGDARLDNVHLTIDDVIDLSFPRTHLNLDCSSFQRSFTQHLIEAGGYIAKTPILLSGPWYEKALSKFKNGPTVTNEDIALCLKELQDSWVYEEKIAALIRQACANGSLSCN